jgi:PTH1 family peptidyl-tRNA hydrolase
MIYTLVPLGNPGPQYEYTRHNAGRLVLREIKLDESKVEVFIPKTFMNDSGSAVYEYLKYHNDRELVVVYDDKDLAIGVIRISFDRGDGGHNGVKSIISSLGTKEFIRVRIGVGPKEILDNPLATPHGEEVQKYVLDKFTDDEMVELKKVSTRVELALQEIVDNGYLKAMERFN